MDLLSRNDFMEKVSVSELRLIAPPSMGCPYYWFGVKEAFGSIKWAIQTS